MVCDASQAGRNLDSAVHAPNQSSSQILTAANKQHEVFHERPRLQLQNTLTHAKRTKKLACEHTIGDAQQCGVNTHPRVSREPGEGERDVAVDLDDFADRSGVLELGSRPPLYPQHHAVLSLDADYRGPLCKDKQRRREKAIIRRVRPG